MTNLDILIFCTGSSIIGYCIYSIYRDIKEIKRMDREEKLYEEIHDEAQDAVSSLCNTLDIPLQSDLDNEEEILT
jgi:hypothetical protein